MTGARPDEVARAPGAAAAPPAPGAVAPPVMPTPAESALSAALARLRESLAALELPLAAPGVDAARADRAAALEQLDTYLLPRLAAPAAPLLVVVGGSTGAGKSTLVNSLLGEQVSVPGVLRPTTRAPVLAHNPADTAWYAPSSILSPAPLAFPLASPLADVRARRGQDPDELGRYEGERGLRVVASEAVPVGLALLDAPDVDSVEEANREVAERLLAAADLWLFVTTAARYADAVPWALLRGAAARHAQVAIVVDRVDPGAEAVVDDLRRMMDGNGLAAAPLFVVPETELAEGLLPETAVARPAAWLSGLAADEPARRAVALATRDGVVDDLVRRAVALARAGDEQVVADARLRTVVGRRYSDATQRVAEATSDGAMLRGEVLARWQDFVGTGEFFRSLEQGVGRLRDRLGRVLRGKPAGEPQVEQAIVSGLEAVLLDAADEAAERTHAVWRTDPAGAPLVAGTDLARSSAGLRAQAAEQVRGWQGDVLDLVREQGASRRATARYLSFGVNAAGVALIVVVFASTGGLVGGELVIAGGTAVVAQKLLEAVFGDDAVRRLTSSARASLDERVRAVLDAEAARYTGLLDALGTSAGGDGLRAAAHEVERVARDERGSRPSGSAAGARSPGRRLRGADLFRSDQPGAGSSAPGLPGMDADARPGTDTAGVNAAARPASRPGFWRRLLRRGGPR